MLDFIPPKDNMLAYYILGMAHKPIMCWACKGLRLCVDAPSLERLKSAYHHSTLLLPNHYNHDDPFLLFALSVRTHQPYYYLAARESFTEQKGGRLRGWIMQQAGCYSVVRGAVDRASFRKTRELIAQGRRPLVIFPEGEISHRSDMVTPFETGIFTLAFWGMEDRIAAGKDSDVWLLPIGIHYFIDPEHKTELKKGLTNLECQLFSQPGDGEILERFQVIGRHMLDVLENSYYGKKHTEIPMSRRIDALRSDILTQIEHFFGLKPRQDAGILDRARAIRNHLDDEVYRDLTIDDQYTKKIHDQRIKTFGSLYKAVKRVCVFHAFDAIAVEKAPRLGTLFETLWLLEEEVYGAPKSLVPRIGEIRVGEQINLNKFRPIYESNKRQAIQEVTLRVENAVKKLVAELN